MEAWYQDLAYLKEICNYWVKDFDWKNLRKKLTNFQNFKTKVDELIFTSSKKRGVAIIQNTFINAWLAWFCI